MFKKSILLTLLLTAFFGMTRAGNNSQGEWEDAIQFTTPEQNTIIQNVGLENNRTLTQTQTATYNGTRWTGRLTSLAPGKGYMFNSSVSEGRILVFPTTSK